MLMFVPPELQQQVRDRLCRLIYVPISFDFMGSQIIYYSPEPEYAELDAARSLVEPFRELASL
jgi:hypothetical protein